MTDECISPLRQRMIEDMSLRHFGEKTQKDYIRAVKNLTIFLGRSPDTATAEDLRLFQALMTKGGASMATKSKRTTRAPARAKAAIPKAGPVTFAEARALAQAKQPKRPGRKLAAPAASPAAVGVGREKLEQGHRDQIARRIREYKATIVIMKKRGARRPQPKAAPKAAISALRLAPFATSSLVIAVGYWFRCCP